MNSAFRKILVALLVLLIVAGVAAFLSLNSMVHRGVVAFGPEVIRAPIQLDGVSLSPLSGKGELTGLVVGNPEGFKTPHALKVGTASLVVNPASLLAEKIVVQSLKADGAKITLEGSLGSSNLGKLQENLDAYVTALLGAAEQNKKAAPGKKLQVNELIISNATIHLSLTMLGGKSATVPLPEIKLNNLGQGAEGVTPAEVVKVVMKDVLGKTTTAVTGYLSGGGKTLLDGAKGVTKGLGDLFKKKD